MDKAVTRKWQKPLPAQATYGGISSTFTWASAYGGKIDVGESNGRLKDKYEGMRRSLDVEEPLGYKGMNSTNPFQRSYVAPRAGQPGRAPPFQFKRPMLASQEFGEHVADKCTKRVLVATIKKWGGPCVHALTLGDEDEEGKGQTQTPTPTQTPSKNQYVANKAELLQMKRKIQAERDAVDKLIDLNKSQNSTLRKKAHDASARRKADATSVVPLAKSCGRFEGDMSLMEIAKIKAKPTTKSAITSDEMKAIMQCKDNRPETAPKKRRDGEGMTNGVHRNAMRTFEASYNEWVNELGKH